jgi:hypothetical protein
MKIPKQGLTGDVLLREAVTEFRAIIDLVRGALIARLYPTEPNKWLDIQAIYADAVVVHTEKGRLFKFPYSIDAENAVVFGTPVEVKTDYVSLKEAVSTDAVFIEAVGNADEANTGKWLIRVIKSGLSGNNFFYSDILLKEALPLFENARVFNKTDEEHLKGKGKAVDNLIGRLTEAKFTPGATPDTGEVTAILELIEPQSPIAIKIREAYSRNMQDLFGFSIDAEGSGKRVLRDGKRIVESTKIKKVLSVDLIVEPGAGGQLIRMTESLNPIYQETDPMKTRMLEAIKKHNPKKFATIDQDAISDDELEAAYREAIATPINLNDDTETRMRMLEAQVRMSNATNTINASTLPQAAKDKLITDFSLREAFDDKTVTSAIDAEREYLGRFTESGMPNLNFGDGARVEDRSVRIAGMLDAFFDPAHAEHRNVVSFKECYIEITGDKRVTGRMENIDQARMRESLGISMREALDTSRFADALGNSITRRMQAIYAGMTDLQAWRKVVTVNRVSDFRTQERIRIGGYGNLPAVAQSAAYTALTSPSDDKATYAVSKRGGTESVTLEMIKNDDVGAIARIPTELALAAANTLYEFVFDFFRTNPNAWDGVALYHASHNNLFSAAFSASEYAKHRLAMLKQTRVGSGKRLATPPKFVLLPFELEEAGYNAFVRNQNLDKDFVQSNQPEIISINYWTDANDWCTLADPMRMPALEIGFLDGQEEPELFIQDSPTVGSMFSNDMITYKIRHIYGGDLLVDAEKATTKAVVA